MKFILFAGIEIVDLPLEQTRRKIDDPG